MLKSLSFTLKALLPYLPSVMASIIILIFVLILLTNHPNRGLTPYSEGLVALASGFSIISKDDYDNMAKQFYVYDALYAFCKSDNKKEKLLTSIH
jgi:hypothetical protein